jgi:hypothetical protein
VNIRVFSGTKHADGQTDAPPMCRTVRNEERPPGPLPALTAKQVAPYLCCVIHDRLSNRVPIQKAVGTGHIFGKAVERKPSNKEH